MVHPKPEALGYEEALEPTRLFESCHQTNGISSCSAHPIKPKCPKPPRCDCQSRAFPVQKVFQRLSVHDPLCATLEKQRSEEDTRATCASHLFAQAFGNLLYALRPENRSQD